MAENLSRSRELLERVSRTVEANPGADAPTIRVRAGVSRQTGDKALELLDRAGFVERRRDAATATYHTIKPYRVSNEGPRPTYGESHSTRQGGGG